MIGTRRLAALAPLVLTLLVACGSDGVAEDAAPQPARTIEITATEYAFNGDPGVIEPGDTIEFDVDNAGQLEHSLEVLSSEGRSLGKTDRIPAGSSAAVTVTFESDGTYRLICDIDDHLSRGQSATITVG